MSLLRFSVLFALCAWGTSSVSSAQIATEIRAQYRDGQTFLTWRELASTGKRYRIYRAEHALRTNLDLKTADFLGEVDDRTARNQGRSLASGNEHGWIIAPGGAEMDMDQGLFVYTVEEARQRRGFYAVTVVQAGGENRTVVPGSNATILPVLERAAPPQPILQNDFEGELWGHWVSDRDTPFQKALAPWPSRGFNFLLQRGTAAGPHGLVVRLHAAGQTYAQAWPQRFETPQDVDGLGLSDLMPYTSYSFWFGAQELLPGAPSSSTTVWNYTQERALWTIDWVTAHLSDGFDPERLYVVGGSMGAIGGMYLVGEQPERFAAALLRNGLYDLSATDYHNPGAFTQLFGAFALGLTTREGLPILDRTNALYMAGRDLHQEWPVLRTLSGRNDETVGWMSAVGLFRGLAELGRPAVHYFDERTHNPNGYWRDLERGLLTRTFQTRRDRPSLRFLGCSLDDEPGDGTRTDGDLVGTINGTVEYDPKTAQRGAEQLDFDVYLRDGGVLDDAPEPRAWAALMPWRTGDFAPSAKEAVRFTLLAGTTVVDDHLLFPDAYGRVRTPPVPLDTTHRHALFQRGPAAAPRALFVGEAPIAGDDMQVVLRGKNGKPWMLVVYAGTAASPIPGAILQVEQGTFGGKGLADLSLPVPAILPAGTVLWVRARIGTTWTSFQKASVQEWLGSTPRHVLPR